MKRVVIVGLALALFSSLSCNRKKDEVVDYFTRSAPVMLDTCAIESIVVTRQDGLEQQVYIESEERLEFTARAYDSTGNEVPADLDWHFRYPDGNDRTTAGLGHRLEVTGPSSASMVASGTTPGRFYVTATASDCQVGPVEHPRSRYGEAVVKVGQRPGSIAACGELRLVMGLKDMAGQTVLASDKANMVAEISGLKKVGQKLDVRFYINGKRNDIKRPLYGDAFVTPDPGMEKGYKANLSIYPGRGLNRIYYELLKGPEVICTSRVMQFNAR